MPTIQVLALGTRVKASARWDSPRIPGRVEAVTVTGAGVRYRIAFDNNFEQDVPADRVEEAS